MKLMSSIEWKLRQLWLKAKCRLRGKRPIPYELWPGVQFVAHIDDVSSHDIYIKHTYEQKELEWCAKWLCDGNSFIDCGANIGFYSACLSQIKNLNKVLAIEGNEICSRRCKDGFQELGLNEIILVKAILHSDETKNLQITHKPGQEGLQYAEACPNEQPTLQTKTLDNLAAENDVLPALIKIDCEGAETEILRGAKNILENIRPAWLIEVNDHALSRAGTTRNELFNLLRQERYRLYHVSSAYEDIPFGIEVNDDLSSWSFNLAAIPNDESSQQRWRNSYLG